MLTRMLGRALLAVAAGPLAFHCAYADIYTWVDASGAVNVSNLTPPSGARVTSVTQTPAKGTDSGAATREAELQAMKERIRNLELEVELATRQPPPVPIDYRPGPTDYRAPPIDYRPAPAPIIVPYASEPMSWPMGYPANVAPQPVSDCPWNCGLAFGSPINPYYAPTVIVVRVPSVRGGHPGHRGRHPFETMPARLAEGRAGADRVTR